MNNFQFKYKNFINELDALNNAGQLRKLTEISDKKGKFIYINGKKYLNLSSNDYLGLANDEEILDEYSKLVCSGKLISKYSMTSASSRLLTGNHELYQELESYLNELYGRESSLVFNSGYHANAGILPALAKKGDLILSDKLNHASIIDGIRLSRADYLRYNHLDYVHLETLLEKNSNKYQNIYIITESVFSMDGDRADLKKIVSLKNKYNAFLIVDEAHAVGVFGNNGLGICEEDELIQDIDIIIATFGKALASVGAYAVMDSVIREYLINKMRTLIFTTALPAFNLFWTLFILKKIPFLNSRRIQLKQLSNCLRNKLNELGLVTAGSSQIVPVIIGNNTATVELSNKLIKAGLWVMPIRPPSVPENSSRLRISLTLAFEMDDMNKITTELKG